MDIKKIAIKEMSWSRNIFIKDLDQDSSIGYWKYKIGGIDYYIPNMGYLVLIDSCFDDLKDSTGIEDLDDGKNIKFKLNADFFEDSEAPIKYAGMDLHVTENDINKVMIDNFKRIFSSNVFSSEFSNYGGIKPPQNIINLITKIGEYNYRDYKKTGFDDNLISVILYNFSDFLHNKVGKVIGETEKPQLYPDGYNIDFCKRGELVAINFNYANNSYYWGIYIEPEKDAFDNKVTIYDDRYKFNSCIKQIVNILTSKTSKTANKSKTSKTAKQSNKLNKSKTSKTSKTAKKSKTL
jgi:hypothetical protein